MNLLNGLAAAIARSAAAGKALGKNEEVTVPVPHGHFAAVLKVQRDIEQGTKDLKDEVDIRKKLED